MMSESRDEPKHSTGHVRANSLGIPCSELDSILDELEQAPGSEAFKARDAARIPFRLESLVIDVSQPGGGQRRVVVAARNISQTNICILHSSYLHTQTSCTVHLPRRSGGITKAPAFVSMCRHITRHVHEIDLTFRESINVRNHIEIDALSQTFGRDKIDPASLAGRVLIVSECAFLPATISHMLSTTGLEISVANSIPSAVEAALSSTDVILCDFHISGGGGIAMIEQARAAFVNCPIVIMSADSSSMVRSQVRAARADGFLVLPLVQNTLHGAIAEFLTQARERGVNAGGTHTKLPINSPLLAQADMFVDSMPALVESLRTSAAKSDIEAVRVIALRLVAAAPPLGFPAIADSASALLRSLASTMSTGESARELGSLMGACRAIRKSADRVQTPVES